MDRRRPSAGAFVRNLRQRMPLGRKARLALRNMLKRVQGEPCCGHPGEPGC